MDCLPLGKITVHLSITSNWCNHWPYIKILVNGCEKYNNELSRDSSIKFDFDLQQNNQLTICHYGKNLHGNWDTQVNSAGSIISDCNFQISELSFNNVKFNELAFKKYTLITDQDYNNIYLNSIVGFNGNFILTIPTDIYSWLTLLKFKHDSIDKLEQYSNYSQLYHYDEDITIIKELKRILQVK